MAIISCGFASVGDLLGIGEEVAHDLVERRLVGNGHAAATGEKVHGLLEAFVVGTEDYGAAVDGGFERVVDANSEASADVGDGGVSVDGG